MISSGTLDSLPHNGAVVTLLAVCGGSHRESYFDIVMVAIVGAILGLAAVIILGSIFGASEKTHCLGLSARLACVAPQAECH